MTEISIPTCGRGVFASAKWPLIVSFGAALMAAGCSADVSRFSGPGFSLNAEDDRAALIPPEALSSGGSSNLSDQTPTAGYSGGAASANIQTSALAAPVGGSGSFGSRSASPREVAYAPDQQPVRRQPDYANRSRADENLRKGEAITVVRGDTLYGLSRRHGVSVAELMTVNGLDDSKLKIGQTLNLPAGATRASLSPRDTKTRPAPPREVVAEADPANVPATWNGRYEMQPGDSLYKVAKQYGVRTAELQRYNSITDPRRMRPGTVLRVPGGATAPVDQAAEAAAQSRQFAPELPVTGERYAALNEAETRTTQPVTKGVQTVRITPPKAETMTDTSEALGASDKLLWPVRGKMVAGFGARADGTHNDGVNFAVPSGTDVMAAQDGVVAYAGSELRSYGNLILVRHDNGWVTAYAHNDKLLVSRGDSVKRGQVIAKSGATGQVSEPQLHFELRQSSKKPVDPIPYLEKL
ncbi:MAG: peptidoglycan DD-metalloendopeptidase family protein [Alphaproteobacteria bacterium]|nr:peptidoglycan DD-metalloendopeptidase family protein [Alphaproteobacteria bacterium]